jgi:hypothetical protein
MWCLKLPIYEVFIDGKPRKIQITKTNECFTVKIDDKTVNARLPTENLSMDEAFKIDIDGKAYKIELPKISYAKPFTVKVEDTVFKAEVKTPRNKSEITTFTPVTLTPSKKTFATRKNVDGAVVAPMTKRRPSDLRTNSLRTRSYENGKRNSCAKIWNCSRSLRF